MSRNPFPPVAALVLSTLASAVLSVGRASAAEGDPSSVVIVANAADPQSVDLAKWYALRRGIPERNIAILRTATQEGISRSEFQNDILSPMQEWLLQNGWLEGFRRGETIEVIRHKVGHIVLMRGMPLRVEHEGSRALSWDEQIKINPTDFRAASVDSELAMLPRGFWAPAKPIPNPLFEKERPSSLDLKQVFKVTRLDGPAAEDVRKLVDSAMKAESDGLIGRAYIDLGGPAPAGEAWIKECGDRLDALGFDVTVDRDPNPLGDTVRFDAPAFYFGWYAPHANGPFKNTAMRFAPGAIAFHLHSFSAETIRRPDTGWVGPFVARGAAAAFGNVAEPRLGFTQRPEMILKMLVSGWCLGDAAAYGTPVLSWMSITVGDPLYRPFKRSLADEVIGLDRVSPELAPFVVIRQANVLAKLGKTEDALKLVVAQEKLNPGLALSLHLARMQVNAGDKAAARKTLEKLQTISVVGLVSWRIASDVAELMIDLGDAEPGLKLFDLLTKQPQLPKEARLYLLDRAVVRSTALGDKARADKWRLQVLELRPPPAPPPAPAK